MTSEDLNSEDACQANYSKTRIAHWDALACKMDVWTGHGGYYHERLAQVYKFLVSPGQRVIDNIHVAGGGILGEQLLEEHRLLVAAVDPAKRGAAGDVVDRGGHGLGARATGQKRATGG